MKLKNIFIIFLFIILFSTTFIYSKALIDVPVFIEAPKKVTPPIFELPPEIPIEESICYGGICFPPGENPFSLGLTFLSNKQTRDFTTTTLDNKIGTAPTTGTYSIPVLLVKFPDMQAPANLTLNVYNDVFNSSNYLSGNGISVKEFYKHNSYNQLNITYDIYDWRQLPLSYSYYVSNPDQFSIDTINLFGTGSNAIDFTQYDSDNDGRLDGVVIVHAGFSGQEQSGHIISQARIYKYNNVYNIQGKLYGNVAIVPSRHVANKCSNWNNNYGYPSDCRTSIGIAVHEYAHVLGLPDLYAINYNGNQSGLGLKGHTVMVLDSDLPQDVKKPVNFDAWSKFFFGWLNPTVINLREQANIYTLTPFDTTDSAYILHNPDTMGDREYFLIVNRYISTISLDRYLFSLIPPLANEYGGLDIFHVDENYIDYTYLGPLAINSIMYDPDGDYYDDTISHPGIVFEQNHLDGNFTTRSHLDLYTGENYWPNQNCNPIVFNPYFDNNSERIDPNHSCQVYRNTTSSSYATLEDSGIRIQGWSPSGVNLKAYLTIDEPYPLFAEILSPQEGSSYGLLDDIYFNGNYEYNIGNVSCQWRYKKEGTTNFVTIANNCSPFSKKPAQINMSEGNYLITYKVTDEFSRETTVEKNIEVVYSPTLYNQIISPTQNQGFCLDKTINFISEYYNSTGTVYCVWKNNNNILSNQCNFSSTPQQLGLTGPNNQNQLLNILPINQKENNVVSSLFNKDLITPPLNSQIITSSREKSVGYIPITYPMNFNKTITLTTTDAVSNFTSEVTIKIGMCVSTNANHSVAVR